MKRLILISLLLIIGCDKSGKKKEEEVLLSKYESKNQTSCPHFVAKFGECINSSDVKSRFNFIAIKDWLYIDCENIKKNKPDIFKKLTVCIQQDCKQIDKCLETLMGKEKSNK
jgi:hypothetical protein